jgi:membrane protease YdiL (CAAX protease family)
VLRGDGRITSVTSTAPLPPPGWYSDPWNVAQWRWWDGWAWTGYTNHWYAPGGPGNVARPPGTVDESLPIRAGWIALVGAVVGVALSVSVYVGLRWAGVSGSNPLLALAAQFGLWAGLLGACRVAVTRYGTGSFRDLGLTVRAVDLALGLGFGIAALIGAGTIARALQAIGIQPHRESLTEPLRRGSLTVVVIVLIAVIGAPFVEELFFRGLLMGGLVARWGAAIGIVGQAVLFGLVHLGPADARGNLGVFLLIAPLGAMLGVLRHGFKRLGPGMFTHAVYNGIIVAIALTR